MLPDFDFGRLVTIAMTRICGRAFRALALDSCESNANANVQMNVGIFKMTRTQVVEGSVWQRAEYLPIPHNNMSATIHSMDHVLSDGVLLAAKSSVRRLMRSGVPTWAKRVFINIRIACRRSRQENAADEALKTLSRVRHGSDAFRASVCAAGTSDRCTPGGAVRGVAPSNFWQGRKLSD